MQSFKEFKASREVHNNRSQLLADVIARIADYKLGAAFQFSDNYDMIEEDVPYTMSLYHDTLSEKAIGLNWSSEDDIVSISYWNDYDSSPRQPTKEILFTEQYDAASIKPVLSAAFDRLLSCKEDKKLLEHVEFYDGDILKEAEEEDSESDELFADLVQKVQAKKAKQEKEEQAKLIDPKTKVARHYADPDHIFADLDNSVKSLCRGTSYNAVLIAGPGGTGKSYHVEKSLAEAGMQPGKDWVKYKVRMTPPQIYLSLLNNDDKIIVFDDCDNALLNKDSSNIFKAALDTNEHRYVSWYKSATIDTTGLPNEVIKGLAMNDKKKRLPSTFEFTGAIIFITNLPIQKIEPALLTRCDVLDVTFTREDMGKVIRQQLENIKIPVKLRATGETVDIGRDLDLKVEVFDYLLSPKYQEHMKKYNMPLDFRLFRRAYTFAYYDHENWQRRMDSVYY